MLFLGIAVIGIGILSSTNVCSSEACYHPVDSTVNGTVYALKEDKFEKAGTFCMSKNVINVVTLGLSLATTIVASDSVHESCRTLAPSKDVGPCP